MNSVSSPDYFQLQLGCGISQDCCDTFHYAFREEDVNGSQIPWLIFILFHSCLLFLVNFNVRIYRNNCRICPLVMLGITTLERVGENRIIAVYVLFVFQISEGVSNHLQCQTCPALTCQKIRALF